MQRLIIILLLILTLATFPIPLAGAQVGALAVRAIDQGDGMARVTWDQAQRPGQEACASTAAVTACTIAASPQLLLPAQVGELVEVVVRTSLGPNLVVSAVGGARVLPPLVYLPQIVVHP